MEDRFALQDLVTFARALLAAAGLDLEKAATVAEILVEADLLGHDTHGLALLPSYLDEIEKGRMRVTGEPQVISDRSAAITWDGLRLPGPWLVVRAIDLAVQRARQSGACTVVIRRSHHIACLAAYLERVTDQGLMMIITCSDPSVSTVAPHGGIREVFTPNPIAAGWPTQGDPVLLDISTSITTNGMTKRLYREKRQMPGPWAIDSQGMATSDPGVLFNEPRGALLPVGGTDHGHKGYALSLLVEALTGSLSGHGRADPSEGWGASVFIQVFDPELFGGGREFLKQSTKVAQACRETPPRPGFNRVRLPGESGLNRRAEQTQRGIKLYSGILEAIAPWAEKLKIALPQPFASTSTPLDK